MAEAERREVLPLHSVCLTTTARGQVTIDVKITGSDADAAASKATDIFDRLRAKYKELNDANDEFYRGK